MSLSASNRRTSMKKAGQLLPGAQVLGYAVGRTGLHPTVAVSVVLGGALVFNLLLLVLTGSFLLPGVLAILVIQHFISPPAGVVVTVQGVALTKRSLWNGRPSEVTSVMAHGYVQPVEESLGRVKVMVGHEAVWMTKGEEQMLREAAAAGANAAAAAVTAGPAPYGASVPLESDVGYTNEVFTEGLGWFARSFVVGLFYTFGGVILLISVAVLFEGKPGETLQGLLMAAVPPGIAEGLRRLTRPKPRAVPTY